MEAGRLQLQAAVAPPFELKCIIYSVKHPAAHLSRGCREGDDVTENSGNKLIQRDKNKR